MTLAAIDPKQSLGIEASQLPRHVAVIMDGNGRWAAEKGLPRIRGHEQGAHVVDEVVTQCARLGIEALTLYSFSIENWRRPKEEVEFLMHLYGQYLVSQRSRIMENNVRLVHLGRRQGLPSEVLQEMDLTIRQSSQNTGLKLCLALNYGARTELIDCIRTLARQATSGKLDPDKIDEKTVSEALYTRGLPDPDLLIRTASEHRLSNFLLWQISYAELFISDVYWPDFTSTHLNEAIRTYAGRQRRFGGLVDNPGR